ncbi:hypothetical protein DFS33DRAFT_656915 [Desarmillaria ectypa]|nr:hypothetical protein DFS33DRAFT_656915 [Desarmillaria ectypa]
MGVTAFFLSTMSSTGSTGAHPDNTTSQVDPKSTANDPVTPHTGAPSTAAAADDDNDANPETTPYNFGAASHRAFHMKYERKDYDNFVKEDLATRVFIPSDDFLHVILHLPRDWRQDLTISALIQKVKADKQWKELWKAYKIQCSNPDETKLYHPHNSLCNRALDLIKNECPSEPEIGFYRQHPKRVKGTNAELCPDTITLLLSLFNSSQNNIADIETGGPKNSIGWPQLLQWLDFKLSKTTLDNGQYATRVLTAGKFLCFNSTYIKLNNLSTRQTRRIQWESLLVRSHLIIPEIRRVSVSWRDRNVNPTCLNKARDPGRRPERRRSKIQLHGVECRKRLNLSVCAICGKARMT